MSILAIWEFFGRRTQRPRCERAAFASLAGKAECAEFCETNTFVASALRAANGAPSPHRRVILTEVAGLLSCGAEDLDFLFDGPVIAANDSDPVAMPDFRAALMDDRHVAVR